MARTTPAAGDDTPDAGGRRSFASLPALTTISRAGSIGLPSTGRDIWPDVAVWRFEIGQVRSSRSRYIGSFSDRESDRELELRRCEPRRGWALDEAGRRVRGGGRRARRAHG